MFLIELFNTSAGGRAANNSTKIKQIKKTIQKQRHGLQPCFKLCSEY